VSGSVPVEDRPAGSSLFDKLRHGDIRIRIAAKLDRLFRSALDALKVVESLKTWGVKLRLLDLCRDIAGNGISKLFLTIAAAFAEAERDRRLMLLAEDYVLFGPWSARHAWMRRSSVRRMLRLRSG